MTLSYDVFTRVFLDKMSEFTFLQLSPHDSNAMIDGYMKRACSQFQKICKHDITSCDDNIREFLSDIPNEDLVEIVDIVTEGMVVQWAKPYVYKAENLENILSTADYKAYSPAELLYRIKEIYNMAKDDFTNMQREYSYKHGDLSALHL